MHSCFFTIEEQLSSGIEVFNRTHSTRRFIPVGGTGTGIQVPVTGGALKTTDRITFGTVVKAPKLHISSLDKLPHGVEPYAVVLVKRIDVALSNPWVNYPLPSELRSKTGSTTRCQPIEIGCGYEMVGRYERSSMLVALPKDTAIMIPLLEQEPMVLAWLGHTKPVFVRRSVIKRLKRFG